VIPKQLDQITKSDLDDLIDEGRNEDRTIEYKLTFPNNAESEKVTGFLKPVCSFANTDGGDVLYGVQAKHGIPTALTGITIDNIDQQKLSIEHMIQSGIEPQVRGVHIREVPLDNGSHILVLRVPKSWIGPHRIKNNSKFYARNSAGSYELDIPQIRQAFLLTDTLAERIRDFRAERISATLGNGTPVALSDGVRIILHLIPLSAVANLQQISVLEYGELWTILTPSMAGSIDYRLNFDGLVVMSGIAKNGYRAYSQLFRNGIIEFVRVYEDNNGKKYIPSGAYELELLQHYKAGVSAMQKLRIEPPFIVLLTLAGAKGYQLGVDQMTKFFKNEPIPFDRNILAIPDTQVESFAQSEIEVLKPMFDVIWNAAGYEESLNFNKVNQWIQQG
jgi:hypothetical protein